jgi:hypothetical protein
MEIVIIKIPVNINFVNVNNMCKNLKKDNVMMDLSI